MTRRMELDTAKLYAEITRLAEERGKSLRQVCTEAGVSQNTTTRLRDGKKVEADILLALLDWIGGESLGGLRAFMRPTAA